MLTKSVCIFLREHCHGYSRAAHHLTLLAGNNLGILSMQLSLLTVIRMLTAARPGNQGETLCSLPL
ncbi:hypothetical protein CBM2599_B50400 [Cupriavidus taiwanensis]|nr:hypothetical protein CBM2600_B10590 [Cupriavidus taiwanensis]SOY96468.1 hypothetical protein CBM2599_B50400 [Cupriavidus taiwanensis]